MSYISNENDPQQYESSGDTIEQITSENMGTDDDEFDETESISSISRDDEDISFSSEFCH